MTLANPVLTASGTFGYGREYARFYDLNELGAVITKGTTLHPCEGNPPPRIVETPSGILNSIGLQNPGLDRVIGEEIPWLAAQGVPVIVNIAGHSFDEYVELARRLSAVEGVKALEVNLSCPNIECRGGALAFGTDPSVVYQIVKEIRAATDLTLIVKLTPNVGDIAIVARAAERGGADAVSLINTFPAMAIDIDTRRPILGNITGGLSGPAIRPIAVRMVWQAFEAVNIPIIGMGGIFTPRDAVEFILAGASAVAVGTANFVDPMAPLKIREGIAAYMLEHGFHRLDDLIGAAHAAAP